MKHNDQLAGSGLKVANTDERANLNGAIHSKKALRTARKPTQ